MSLNSYQYFLVTAEELSITRAAERLYISQQSLSAQIQKLEKQYGVKLFERKPSLRLTLAGERMVPYCQRMVETEKQLITDMADLSLNAKGKLTVGITYSRGQIFFPEIWAKFHKQYPNISVSLVENVTANLEELLQNGKIDLYIGINTPENPNLVRVPLALESLYCLINHELLKTYRPEHYEQLILQFQKGVDLRELADFPFVLLSKNNRLRAELDRLFASRGMIPWVPLESTQHSLIYQFSSEGHGVGIILQMYLYQKLKNLDERPAFHIFPVKNQIGTTSTELVYRNDGFHSQYMQGFIHTTQQVFKHYSDTIQAIIQPLITGI